MYCWLNEDVDAKRKRHEPNRAHGAVSGWEFATPSFSFPVFPNPYFCIVYFQFIFSCYSHKHALPVLHQPTTSSCPQPPFPCSLDTLSEHPFFLPFIPPFQWENNQDILYSRMVAQWFMIHKLQAFIRIRHLFLFLKSRDTLGRITIAFGNGGHYNG